MSETAITKQVTPVVRVVRDEPIDMVDEQAPVNPLVRVHALLHGRYPYAIALGVLFAIGAAVAAWFLIPPKYQIVGYIQVKSYIPRLLESDDQTGLMPGFEPFMQLQESLLQSQRVLDRATQYPEWKPFMRPAATDSEVPMTDELAVDHDRGSELITVTATDRDLNVASTAVKCILQAYMEISGETEGASNDHLLQVLGDLKASLSNQQKNVHVQLEAMAKAYPTSELSALIEQKVEDLNHFEATSQALALQLSMRGSAAGATTQPDQQASVPANLTPDQIAVTDVRMREYLTQKDKLDDELARLRTRLGPNHADVLTARGELAACQQQIDDLTAQYNSQPQSLPAPNGGRNLQDVPIAQLIAQQKRVQGLYDQAHTDMLELCDKRRQVEDLNDSATSIALRLKQVGDRIDQLNLEAPMSGRISVMSYGERPATAPKSKRVPLTAAAGVGGFAMGVALIACWGLLDRRARSIIHIQQLDPAVPLLGVLPILPDELSNPEQAIAAAHSVHQLRNLLDGGRSTSGRTLAITSPVAGDGKTSLTVSLGLSFASSGSRTLLIDCDMVGGGLTSRLNAIARRRIGSILRSEGLVTRQQLKAAREIARSSSRRLGEVILELGYASEEDLQRVLSIQDESSVGLLEALDGEELPSCVTQVLSKGLYVLPLGDAASRHSSQMSPKAIRKVLEEASRLFDTVIVDTGPILGSLEASIVVREVQDVVLAVSRNAQVPLIRRAISVLQTLGVHVTGMVFNRATPDDVSFSHYGTSVSRASVRSSHPERSNGSGVRGSVGRPPVLGSLARAVVNSSADTSGKEAFENVAAR